MDQAHRFSLPTYASAVFFDDPSRWEAVRTRNTLADGHFVYAVKTTRIYCRPICKARLARRANVSFYTSSREASEAGFRACKRCKPEMEGFMPEERAVCQIRKFVMEKGDNVDGERLSLRQMARKTGLSKWHFHRVFKKTVGVTPTEYLENERAAGWQAVLPCASEADWDVGNGEGAGSAATDGYFDLDAMLDVDESSKSTGVEGMSTGVTRGPSPLSFEDLLVWPEG